MSKTNKINIKIVVDYWEKGAERNYATAEFLYKGKNYSDCLFFCHLMIEKILKALVVIETKTHAPYIHDLERLALIANLLISKEQLQNLKNITEFNIAGRYDDAKSQFYKKCTQKYTERHFEICKELYLWLKKESRKK